MEDARVVRSIAEDPRTRRELLWLRAKEKGEAEQARGLEEVDPLIADRLRAAGLEPAEQAGESPAQRRERDGRLWNERYALHAIQGKLGLSHG
jgi:hypothetical protein